MSAAEQVHSRRYGEVIHSCIVIFLSVPRCWVTEAPSPLHDFWVVAPDGWVRTSAYPALAQRSCANVLTFAAWVRLALAMVKGHAQSPAISEFVLHPSRRASFTAALSFPFSFAAASFAADPHPRRLVLPLLLGGVLLVVGLDCLWYRPHGLPLRHGELDDLTQAHLCVTELVHPLTPLGFILCY